MCSDLKMSTTSRVITGKFSFKRLLSLKLSTTFSTTIYEGKAFTMSWNSNLVFRAEIAPKTTQLYPKFLCLNYST